MTAIALRDAADLEPVTAYRSSLVEWAEQARQAASVAQSLAKTPFVPASLRDRDPGVTAANITAAILTGQEIGLEPMAALRSIDIIQGTPALRAIALRAVVLSAGHELWVAESTEARAIVRGRRRGSDQVQESKWTTDRAQKLGLTSKENWRKQPGAMLVARATAECARLIAADALLGVPYVAEELADGDDGVQVVPSSVGPSAGRTARRRTTPTEAPTVRPPVAHDEPSLDPEPDFERSGLDEFHPDTTSNPDPPEGITPAQSRKLHAGLNDIGMGDRDDGLGFIGARIGREIASSKELSKDEASAVIEHIETMLTPDALPLAGA